MKQHSERKKSISYEPVLSILGQRVRKRVLEMAHSGQTPHVGSALSSVDLLVALYFASMQNDPKNPQASERDRFVLGKGHGCMAHYAVLAERGYFPAEILNEYAQEGGRLAEHPSRQCVPGVEIATGSLGHGLPIAAGIALAAKMRGLKHRVFTLISDGECYEGSIWEAATFAAANQLDNLVCIIDFNGWSAMSRTTKALEPLAVKWTAFGWGSVEIDGHSFVDIASTLSDIPAVPGRPTAVVARTVKGKGVSFMEDDLEWHYRPPNSEDLRKALAEIEADNSTLELGGNSAL